MTKNEVLEKIDKIWLLLANVQEKNLDIQASLLNKQTLSEQEIFKEFNSLRMPHREAITELLLLRNQIETMK